MTVVCSFTLPSFGSTGKAEPPLSPARLGLPAIFALQRSENADIVFIETHLSPGFGSNA
jgi:hypothetical protein